jgi:predicted nucleotidyltransferase
MKCKKRDLQERPRGDSAKVARAAQLRREMMLRIRQLAERLQMGRCTSFNNKLLLPGETFTYLVRALRR